MQEQLNDLEVAKIEAFCKDPEMFEAVRKVLFSVIYSDGVVAKDKPLRKTNATFNLIANAYSEDGKISNEELGANLRAKFEGVHCILDGFDQMKNIKSKVTEVESPYNEAI